MWSCIVQTIKHGLLLSLMLVSLASAQTLTPGSKARGMPGHLGYLSVGDLVWNGTDFRQTGGPGYVLRQETVGGPVVPGLLASTDLSDTSTLARLTGSHLSGTRIDPRATEATDTGTITLNSDAFDGIYMLTVTQTTTILLSGTPTEMQLLRLRLCSTSAQTLIWSSGAGKFDTGAPFGLPLPTATRGGNLCDLVIFQYAGGAVDRWQLISTTQPLLQYGAVQLHPNSATFAVAEQPAEINNGTGVVFSKILFDDTTKECVAWTFVMPEDYGSAPTLELKYSLESDQTAGYQVHFDVEVMVEASADLDVTSYDTVNNCNDTSGTPTTVAGLPRTITCALTNVDGLAAGKLTKLKLCRDVTNDTTVDDVEVRGALVRYTR